MTNTVQQSPITDKTLNIAHQPQEKFREVRRRAHLEELDRHKKAKRNRTIKVPRFKIGESVVIKSGGYRNPQYCLVEIIDFQQEWIGFLYYGFLLKTTDPSLFSRIGRLTHFSESGWNFGYIVANVEDKNIKWRER